MAKVRDMMSMVEDIMKSIGFGRVHQDEKRPKYEYHRVFGNVCGGRKMGMVLYKVRESECP